MRRFASRHSHYDPDQPRVPAGNPEGGQWTRAGGASDTRVAAADKPRLGSEVVLSVLAELAQRVIEAYRSENGLRDLFGHKDGAVTWTRFNGKDIFGSNSRSPTYTSVDRAAADRMRAILIEKYPDVMKRDNIGQKPNDAMFHAETTVLLRAARENRGTLSDQRLEVYADRPMCESCETLLPYVGSELGNPTVTFVDPVGRRLTMKNGAWLD